MWERLGFSILPYFISEDIVKRSGLDRGMLHPNHDYWLNNGPR